MRQDRVESLHRMGQSQHEFTLALSERLREVEHKVARLEQEVYGNCEKCGEKLGPCGDRKP